MGRLGNLNVLGLWLVVGLMTLAWEPAAQATSKPLNGEALYLKYCGACHGPEGKGDGVAASALQPPPSDLTQLAKKNGGTFNDVKVMDIIKGTNTLRAHGDAKMPVWGEVLYQPSSHVAAPRAGVQSKVMALTQYLRSIQEK